MILEENESEVSIELWIELGDINQNMTIHNFSNWKLRFFYIGDEHVKQLRQISDTFIDWRIILESMTLTYCFRFLESAYALCLKTWTQVTRQWALYFDILHRIALIVCATNNTCHDGIMIHA